MALYFKTIRSSSSGNCLAIRTERNQILIDCGFSSQKSCEYVLREHLSKPSYVDAVVITHNHGDHISYSSLRIMEKYGIQVWIHEDSVSQLIEKHFNGYRFQSLQVKLFSDSQFRVGNLSLQPIRLPHQPGYPTYGFVIRCREQGRCYKVTVAGDFYDGSGLLEHLINADLVYVESNHDPHLLELYPNYNSRFHMNNPNTAQMLCDALSRSRRMPKAVILGHLSLQRNDEAIAINEVREAMIRWGHNWDCKIYIAPRYEASRTITLI